MRQTILQGGNLASEMLDLGLEALDFFELLGIRAGQELMLLPPVRNLRFQFTLMALLSIAICSLRRPILLPPALCRS